jgi:hypothetical protein
VRLAVASAVATRKSIWPPILNLPTNVHRQSERRCARMRTSLRRGLHTIGAVGILAGVRQATTRRNGGLVHARIRRLERSNSPLRRQSTGGRSRPTRLRCCRNGRRDFRLGARPRFLRWLDATDRREHRSDRINELVLAAEGGPWDHVPRRGSRPEIVQTHSSKRQDLPKLVLHRRKL